LSDNSGHLDDSIMLEEAANEAIDEAAHALQKLVQHQIK